MKHRGIGKWTAESILMRGIGRQDILPAGDLIIRKVVGEIYEYNELLTESQVRKYLLNGKLRKPGLLIYAGFTCKKNIINGIFVGLK
ncbi:hypothetical protein G3M54_33365 [Bacillus megaterium NBRC 15308 = ATCC 14581]|nr:hypothetical protein [Priestia megaterium NBRC 15308 = ATCC 14581]